MCQKEIRQQIQQLLKWSKSIQVEQKMCQLRKKKMLNEEKEQKLWHIHIK